MDRQKQSGELALIEQIRRRAGRAKSSAVRLGIGDDCAILRVPRGQELLVTTDFSLEGRHFRRDWHTPESIGHRCLARGLSDIAAMGGHPLAAFLSLALPAELAGGEWVSRFFNGLLALAEANGVPLAGGDAAQSPDGLVLADITLLGSAPTGNALRRSGARAGDALYVTGTLGGAAAELATLSQDAGQSPRSTATTGAKWPTSAANTSPHPAAKISLHPAANTSAHPHLFPQPRIQVGLALLRRGLASACIDVSDGLSTDLAHLCAESNLCAEVEEAALPIHPLATEMAAAAPAAPATATSATGGLATGSPNAPHSALGLALQRALHGGEDYELLFTAPAKTKLPSRIAGVPITRIGRMVEKKRGAPRMVLIAANGKRQPLKPSGWEHFRGPNSTP